jgi:ribosome maturation factor RimP
VGLARGPPFFVSAVRLSPRNHSAIQVFVPQSKIIATLESIVEPICAAHGVELVDAKFIGSKQGGVVRVLIDRPREDGKGSGVSVDDCKQVSRDLSTAFDLHENLFPGRYQLEVSSPGLERPLVKAADYTRFAGREAKIQTRLPIDDRRNFTGVLVGVDGNTVRLSDGKAEFKIPLSEIAKAHLVHRF